MIEDTRLRRIDGKFDALSHTLDQRFDALSQRFDVRNQPCDGLSRVMETNALILLTTGSTNALAHLATRWASGSTRSAV